MDSLPFISIIIPCRNEEKFIGQCLSSIIANDYPKDQLEVLIVDGISEDETRDIIKEYAQQYPFIKVLDNSKKFIPTAMNIGIQHAIGNLIFKMDAHSTYEKSYISNCVRVLREFNADNVGGALITMPGANTLIAKSISLSVSHLFGAGNSYLRIGSKAPRWVDTTGFGCYKREVFNRIGLYNENLIRSSDMDFNVRLRSAGGKILLVPEIVAYYRARPTLRAFWKHNFEDGLWAVYPLKFGSRTFYWRHLVPLVFVLSLLSSAALSTFSSIFLWLFLSILSTYALANIGSSVHISIKEKSSKYLLTVPVAFVARHIPYGLGSLYGLLKVLTAKQFWMQRFGHGKKDHATSEGPKGV